MTTKPMSKDEAKSLAVRLANYKKMHEKKAKADGCYAEFMASTTLTRARRILWGHKSKSFSGYRGHPDWSGNKGRK